MQDTMTPPAGKAAPRDWLSARYWVPALLLLFLVVLPFLLASAPFYLHVAIMCLLFAYWGVAWNLVGGYAGALSLGHAAYAGLGAYASTLLLVNLSVSPWLGLIAAGGLATIGGLIIGWPTLKLKGPYFALATFALADTLRVWLDNTTTLGELKLGGSMGISLPIRGDSPLYFEFADKTSYYFVALAMMLAGLYLVYRIHHSRLGYQLAAIRTSVDAAESLGVNFGRTRLIVFGLSALLTGLGGTFFAQYIRYINPDRLFGFDLSFEILLLVIAGGRATVLGPVMASIIVTPWREFSTMWFSGTVTLFGYNFTPTGLHILLYGALLVLVMLFLPDGINDAVMRRYWQLVRWLDGWRTPKAVSQPGPEVAGSTEKVGGR